MDAQKPFPKSHFDYKLRLITICAFVPGTTLLVPAGLATKHALPFLNLISLSISAFLGLVAVATKGKPVPKIVYADLSIAIFIIAILIPTWVFLAEHDNINASEILMLAYGTTPVMVDFCIHSYLVLRFLPDVDKFISQACRHCNQSQACPNRDHTMPPKSTRWRGRVTLPNDPAQKQCRPAGNRSRLPHEDEAYESLVKAYSAEGGGRESSDFQTSGFNTPRVSAETLGSGTEASDGLLVNGGNVGSLV